MIFKTSTIARFAFAAALCMGVAAQAQTRSDLSAPIPGNLDSRVVAYAYTPHVVYHLPVTVGMHTHIAFGPGEELVEKPRLGETVRWMMEGDHINIYVKALAPNVSTSMTLVTNKRTYQFELTATTKPSERIQAVKFTYPDDEALFAFRARSVAQQEREAVESKVEHLRAQNLSDQAIDPRLLSFYRVETDNPSYMRMHAYNDGVRTWIRLPPGIQDLPAVFMHDKDEKGRMALMPVNYTVADRDSVRDRDVLIVERVAPTWVLKIGQSVEVRLVSEK